MMCGDLNKNGTGPVYCPSNGMAVRWQDLFENRPGRQFSRKIKTNLQALENVYGNLTIAHGTMVYYDNRAIPPLLVQQRWK